MSKKRNDSSSQLDKDYCGDDNDDENDTFFYESAYREEEAVEDCDHEPILLLTTCSDDSDYVPIMTAIVSVKGKKKSGKELNSSITRNQFNNIKDQQDGLATAVEMDGHNYEDRDEDEALVETVAMNFGMSSNRNGCCCCCCSRQLCPCLKINNCSYDNEFHEDEIAIDMIMKPSNEKLLSIAFISFLTFTCCQAIAAYLAQSEAMMGDSAAMAVDAFTYAFNLIAERIKNNNVSVQHESHPSSISLSTLTSPCPQSNNDLNTLNADVSQTVLTPRSLDTNSYNADSNLRSPREIQRCNLRSKRKLNLMLELIPPLVSVTTLIIVTSVILKKAIETLIMDAHRGSNEQATPNLILMLVFSCLNLTVDVVNVYFFAKARHALGYNTDVGATGRIDSEDDQGADWVQRHPILYRQQENDICQHQGGTQTKKIKMNKKPKKNVIGIAKEKLARTIKKELRSRRKDGAAYLHLAAVDSGSDEDYQFDAVADDDSGGTTPGHSQYYQHNTCRTKVSRKFDESSQNYQHLDYMDDNMDELCIKGISLSKKMKAITIVEGDGDGDGDGDGGGGGGEEKKLQRQSQLEGKEEKRTEHWSKPKNATITESGALQLSPESMDQFNDSLFQNTSSGEDEEIGMVADNEDDCDEEANLNMCSAYTHVFADTIRSIAVLVAAILAELVEGITSEVADAAAAVAVSIIILLALLPLFVGIKRAWYEIRIIWTEERNEL